MNSTAALPTADSIPARAALAAQALEGLFALPREDRPAGVSAWAWLPEVAEATKALPEGQILHWQRMADGSAFAQVSRLSDRAVLMSSDRCPDHDDRVARFAALATVAQAYLSARGAVIGDACRDGSPVRAES